MIAKGDFPPAISFNIFGWTVLRETQIYSPTLPTEVKTQTLHEDSTTKQNQNDLHSTNADQLCPSRVREKEKAYAP